MPIAMPCCIFKGGTRHGFFCYISACTPHFTLHKTQNKHISSRFAFRGENFLVTLRLIRHGKGERAFKGEKVKGWKGEKMAAPNKGERVKRWKDGCGFKPKCLRMLHPWGLELLKQRRFKFVIYCLRAAKERSWPFTNSSPTALEPKLINLQAHKLTNFIIRNIK